MEDWFDDVDDEDRFCYLRADSLEEAVGDSRVLDGLMQGLKVPGKEVHLKRMDIEEKQEVITQTVEHHIESRTSLWHEQKPLEVLAAVLWRSTVPVTLKKKLWGSRGKEADLLMPISRWLREENWDTYAEVVMGPRRIDVVAHKGHKGLLSLFFEEKVVGIELKNNLQQFTRGLDQMTTFAGYVNRIYLACTPWMAASYLEKHASAPGVKRWDADVFEEKLERADLGLILVDGEDVEIVREPEEQDVSEKRLEELHDALKRSKRI